MNFWELPTSDIKPPKTIAYLTVNYWYISLTSEIKAF